MEKRLNQLRFYTIKELAYECGSIEEASWGIMGVELWFHANIDREQCPSSLQGEITRHRELTKFCRKIIVVKGDIG